MKEKTWDQIQENSNIFGIKLMFAVYRGLGRKTFGFLLVPVIVYYFCMQAGARRASLQFLAKMRTLGALPKRGALLGWSIKHFIEFGQSILDKLAVWSGNISVSDVSYEGREEFLRAIEGGQGALIIASHLGNLEACRVLAQSHGRVKLNVLAHTKHAERFSALMREIDPNTCLKLVQVTELSPATAVMLNECVQAGEAVVIAGDRTPVGGGERQALVEFLGEPALLPQGPYILAALLKCPVYLLFSVRDGDSFKIFLEKFSDRVVLQRATREEQLHDWAQAYAKRLAYYALRFPLQWFNFYNFWYKPAPLHSRDNSISPGTTQSLGQQHNQH